jgi:ABC-type nitrate/sulfonate/bicarbonate transport system ATPase subunit
MMPNGERARRGSSVEVVGVSKSFARPGGVLQVLDQISLEAKAGEFISVIGPSGCGKSTMFNILAGLERPDRGEIRIDGEVVTGEKEHFAYMPQKDLLFAWRRVIDNAALGLEIQGLKRNTARARVEPLLATFGLSEFAHCYPFELSGGMRQRVALLRTVVQERQVVLLDEPFGALDYLTRTDLQLWLSQMWERFHWTVILITHDVPEAILLSDRIYVLGARPSAVRRCVEVDLGRPRGLECLASPRFAELEELLLHELRGFGDVRRNRVPA